MRGRDAGIQVLVGLALVIFGVGAAVPVGATSPATLRNAATCRAAISSGKVLTARAFTACAHGTMMNYSQADRFTCPTRQRTPGVLWADYDTGRIWVLIAGERPWKMPTSAGPRQAAARCPR